MKELRRDAHGSEQDLQTAAHGQISPLPLFVSRVLLEHRHTHSFVYCLWLFPFPPWQNWRVATDTICSEKPKIVTIKLFIEKVCQTPALEDSILKRHLFSSNWPWTNKKIPIKLYHDFIVNTEKLITKCIMKIQSQEQQRWSNSEELFPKSATPGWQRLHRITETGHTVGLAWVYVQWACEKVSFYHSRCAVHIPWSYTSDLSTWLAQQTH